MKARIHEIDWNSEGWKINTREDKPNRRIVEMKILSDASELQGIDPTKPITITQEVEEDES